MLKVVAYQDYVFFITNIIQDFTSELVTLLCQLAARWRHN